MAGREEQKRRVAAEARAAIRARSLLAREVLELCERGDINHVRGYLQTILGMTKPFSEIRRELHREVNHETSATFVASQKRP